MIIININLFALFSKLYYVKKIHIIIYLLFYNYLYSFKFINLPLCEFNNMYGIYFTYGSYGSKLTINLQFYNFSKIESWEYIQLQLQFYNFTIQLLTITITILQIFYIQLQLQFYIQLQLQLQSFHNFTYNYNYNHDAYNYNYNFTISQYNYVQLQSQFYIQLKLKFQLQSRHNI